jgi:hypothetical protein
MGKRSFLAFVLMLVLAALACMSSDESPTATPDSRAPEATATTATTDVVEPTAPPVVDQPTAVTTGVEPTPAKEPAATPTPVAEPTEATTDPNLDEWTILVYLDGDNNLEEPALYDMNEMEAAGQNDKVNVLVQIDRIEGYTDSDDDWADTRRYEIQQDDDYNRITSPVVEELGEVNMGDPAELTEFLVWGITNYPANRYALVMWDHGAGWIGVAFDDTTSDGDGITMLEMADSMATALEQTGVDKFDVIAFDACLMGQLEVYTAVQPYARYAIGSEELVPGLGWDYEATLRHLMQKPNMSAANWASTIPDDFVNFYTVVDPDDYVTMSTVDLEQWPRLATAMDQLSAAMMADPVFTASAIGDARAGAEGYALIYPEDAEYYAAIDLWHFASILSQRSPDEAVTAAALEVMAAVDNTVLAENHGAGFQHSRGVSIYFPRTIDYFAGTYEAETTVPTWHNFLASYHGLGLSDIPAPEFNITYVLDHLVGVQKPAYMEVEIIGRDIENVALIGGRYEPDGRLLLLEYDNLIPEPTYLPDGSQLYEWRDGYHDDFFVWNTTSTFLYDANQGDYVVMWPTSYESPLYSVVGRYRRAGAQGYFDANLVFDTSTGAFDSAWTFQSEAKSAPNEIFPEPGDEFQVYNQYLDNNGDITYEPGVSIFFDENLQVYYTWLPVPSGEYFLGFSAETIAGEVAEAFEDYTVDNTNVVEGYQGYLDPYEGFQFLYPDNWYNPSYDSVQLYTSDFDGQTYLYVTLYPNVSGNAQALKDQTLVTFGAVDVLNEQQVTVGGMPALYTAYGYEDDNGPRTGQFLTFVDSGKNLGFVVDLDGPESAEDINISTMQMIIDSWVFQPAGFGLHAGNWATLEGGDFQVNLPSDFTYQELDAGWQFFGSSDNVSFVALRSDDASGDEPTTVVADWAEIASTDDDGNPLTGFSASEPYRFPLGSTAWARVDFEYVNVDGLTVWGFLMATTKDGKDIVAWAEAPQDIFNELETSVFLVAISDLNLADGGTAPPAEEPGPGLTTGYQQTFDEVGNWAYGSADGVEANVNNGVYDFLVSSEGAIWWVYGGEEFGDGTYQVEATQAEGPLNNGYGLMLRADSTTDSFYLLEVSGDGYIWIGRCDDACNTVDQVVNDGWFASDAVNAGVGGTNLLRVEAKGTTLVFFVNDQEVGRITDATIDRGDIGLFVETIEGAGVRIHFDNFTFTPAESK